MNWLPMQHEDDLDGDVVATVWKSKKTAWLWLSLYRSNDSTKRVVWYESDMLSISLHWRWRSRHYRLVAMEWLGLVPRRRRWVHRSSETNA